MLAESYRLMSIKLNALSSLLLIAFSYASSLPTSYLISVCNIYSLQLLLFDVPAETFQFQAAKELKQLLKSCIS